MKLTAFAAVLAIFLQAVALQADDRIAAAKADYEILKSAFAPDQSFVYIRYLIFPLEEEGGVNWDAAVRFAIPSASLERNLNKQIPLKIADGVYRIDLRGLGWSPSDLIHVLTVQKYPYSTTYNPLYIRGDWMIYQLSDQSESIAYPTLLLGRGASNKRDGWLKSFGVDRRQVEAEELNHGMVEAESGVAVQSGAAGHKIRILEFFARLGGYASGTRDFLKITVDNSPLENPDLKGLKHDGEEWIVGVPKLWHVSEEYQIREEGSGVLQYYFLSDGAGNVVGEANVKLVEDKLKFKGLASIRSPGSCVNCHSSGLNQPAKNGLKSWIEAGVELKAKEYEDQEFVDRWHLSGTSKNIERANEDFSDTVKVATGVEASEAVAAYVAANDFYRADVTLAVAAAELGATEDDLRNALAYASDKEIAIGGHLSSLAHSQPIGRHTWESLYLSASSYLELWRKSK